MDQPMCPVVCVSFFTIVLLSFRGCNAHWDPTTGPFRVQSSEHLRERRCSATFDLLCWLDNLEGKLRNVEGHILDRICFPSSEHLEFIGLGADSDSSMSSLTSSTHLYSWPQDTSKSFTKNEDNKRKHRCRISGTDRVICLFVPCVLLLETSDAQC